MVNQKFNNLKCKDNLKSLSSHYPAIENMAIPNVNYEL